MSPDDAPPPPDPHASADPEVSAHGATGGPDATPPAPLPEPPATPLNALDPRVVSYWRVHALITSVVLLGVAVFIGGWVAAHIPGSMPVVAGIWVALLALRLWLWWWHPGRAYRAWGYRVEDRVIEIRQGIWFRTVTLVPLSRLQHVDLQRGPIERSYGLATLILFTAGTQHASIPLPGLEAERAAQLRDFLVAAGGDDAV